MTAGTRKGRMATKEDDFLNWLATAQRGNRYVYHTGQSLHNGRGAVVPIARMVAECVDEGIVTAVQKRLTSGKDSEFAYFVVKL